MNQSRNASPVWPGDWFRRSGILLVVSTIVFATYAAVSAITRSAPVEYEAVYVPPPALVFDHQRVSFLGDSYTIGAGATSTNLGYASILSKRQCWDENVIAHSGTGYLNGGPDGMSGFTNPDRIGALIANKPTLVIVQGGTEDSPTPDLYSAARRVYDGIRAGAPDATIVVVGPAAPPNSSPPDVQTLRREIQRAAMDSEIPFVDPTQTDWLTSSDYASDGQHPNTQGHAKLASNLRLFLSELGIPRFDSCAPVTG